ncbi:MAG: hypothetical protein AAGG11_06125 [Pseudomonadota bacterium]
MKTTKIVIGTVLTIGILGSLGSVVGSSLVPSALAAAPWGDAEPQFARFRGPGRQHGSARERCERMDPEHVKYAGAFASAFLDLNAEQRDALEPVLSALRGWATEAQTLCPSLESVAVSDRLTTMQAFLQISADSLNAVKAAYEQFEPQLTADQLTRLEEAMQQRGRHRW